MKGMTRVLQLLEANAGALASVPSNTVVTSSTVTPGPRSLITDFVTVTPGNYCCQWVKCFLYTWYTIFYPG